MKMTLCICAVAHVVVFATDVHADYKVWFGVPWQNPLPATSPFSFAAIPNVNGKAAGVTYCTGDFHCQANITFDTNAVSDAYTAQDETGFLITVSVSKTSLGPNSLPLEKVQVVLTARAERQQSVSGPIGDSNGSQWANTTEARLYLANAGTPGNPWRTFGASVDLALSEEALPHSDGTYKYTYGLAARTLVSNTTGNFVTDVFLKSRTYSVKPIGYDWMTPAAAGWLLTDTITWNSGDFNYDGSVDAADYVPWRKAVGSAADYNAWRENFGATTAGAAAAAQSASQVPVPEPSSLPLAAIAVASVCGWRRSEHRNRSDFLPISRILTKTDGFPDGFGGDFTVNT
jgi:hypothetical protein